MFAGRLGGLCIFQPVLTLTCSPYLLGRFQVQHLRPLLLSISDVCKLSLSSLSGLAVAVYDDKCADAELAQRFKLILPISSADLVAVGRLAS